MKLFAFAIAIFLYILIVSIECHKVQHHRESRGSVSKSHTRTRGIIPSRITRYRGHRNTTPYKYHRFWYPGSSTQTQNGRHLNKWYPSRWYGNPNYQATYVRGSSGPSGNNVYHYYYYRHSTPKTHSNKYGFPGSTSGGYGFKPITGNYIEEQAVLDEKENQKDLLTIPNENPDVTQSEEQSTYKQSTSTTTEKTVPDPEKNDSKIMEEEPEDSAADDEKSTEEEEEKEAEEEKEEKNEEGEEEDDEEADEEQEGLTEEQKLATEMTISQNTATEIPDYFSDDVVISTWTPPSPTTITETTKTSETATNVDNFSTDDDDDDDDQSSNTSTTETSIDSTTEKNKTRPLVILTTDELSPASDDGNPSENIDYFDGPERAENLNKSESATTSIESLVNNVSNNEDFDYSDSFSDDEKAPASSNVKTKKPTPRSKSAPKGRQLAVEQSFRTQKSSSDDGLGLMPVYSPENNGNRKDDRRRIRRSISPQNVERIANLAEVSIARSAAQDADLGINFDFVQGNESNNTNMQKNDSASINGSSLNETDLSVGDAKINEASNNSSSETGQWSSEGSFTLNSSMNVSSASEKDNSTTLGTNSTKTAGENATKNISSAASSNLTVEVAPVEMSNASKTNNFTAGNLTANTAAAGNGSTQGFMNGTSNDVNNTLVNSTSPPKNSSSTTNNVTSTTETSTSVFSTTESASPSDKNMTNATLSTAIVVLDVTDITPSTSPVDLGALNETFMEDSTTRLTSSNTESSGTEEVTFNITEFLYPLPEESTTVSSIQFMLTTEKRNNSEDVEDLSDGNLDDLMGNEFEIESLKEDDDESANESSSSETIESNEFVYPSTFLCPPFDYDCKPGVNKKPPKNSDRDDDTEEDRTIFHTHMYASVEIEHGSVLGVQESSADGNSGNSRNFVFLGIPYALPPVGDLRFKPPVPQPGWTGTWNATASRPKCLQYDSIVELDVVGQEDCLYLNVYTPKLPSSPEDAKLPVLVYVNGVFFSSGSGNEDQVYPASFLQHDVIVVTVNYRLGVFGFLSTEDEAAPGNYGLLDIAEALKWVHTNIVFFGGDVGSVTLGGYGSGASAAHLLAFSPAARELFSGMILQAGSALSTGSLTTGHRKVAKTLAAHLGCSIENSNATLQCLRRRSATSLINEAINMTQPFTHLFAPRIDKECDSPIVREDPLELLQKGEFCRVPLLIGFPKDVGLIHTYGSIIEIISKEIQILSRPNLYLNVLDTNWTKVCPVSLQLQGTSCDCDRAALCRVIRKEYFGQRPIDLSSAYDLTNLMGDRWFKQGITQSAAKHSKFADTYFYVYNYEPKYSFRNVLFSGPRKTIFNISADFTDGVFYGDDLLAAFPSKGVTDRKRMDDEISRFMVQLWVNFLKHRKPIRENRESIISWPKFTEENERYFVIDNPPKQRTNPVNPEVTKFWEFVSYISGAV
ncbi:unnamed protein product [Notodromas monacha]|uniref:Carboxylesterase type B domain-containing protein n=1 Tax=Notodromas monacha TaxID=399045 RepID=A0A7R9GII8_9CRUS|nr:unnamed protein product [Notodromas monacha]CAG0923892.1 unnamed protein product [Notodromas monacha]